MSLRNVETIGIGEIKLSKEQTEEYKTIVWKDLVYTMGEKIIDSYKEKLSSRKFGIFFFPKGNITLEDFVTKLNTSITKSILYIQYDTNLRAIDCTKVEDEIPTQLVYLIVD